MMLWLASTSPRRRALLSLGGWDFQVQPAHVDETVQPGELAAVYVERLALEKARRVTPHASPGDIVIAADTTVLDGEHILGKPATPHEATAMLRSLRARPHQVSSALVVLRLPDGFGQAEVCCQDLVTTTVWMRDYSDPEIETYVASGDPMDKAGAYAIQHAGFRPVERLQGCYTNVVGLPLCRLARLLAVLGAPPVTPLTWACFFNGGQQCSFPSEQIL